MDETTYATPNRGKKRLKRFILGWLLLVLVLAGYKMHEKLSKDTHFNFSVSLNGKPISEDAKITLDFIPFSSGQVVSIGNHTLTITHPKTESFSKETFAWYGDNSLGEIKLTRAKGSLAITTKPQAVELSVSGPEFSGTFQNTGGTNLSVPSDEYVVRAKYLHGTEAATLLVSPNTTATCRFAPAIGDLEIRCTHADAKFQLFKSNGTIFESGTCPTSIPQVPSGNYRLIVSRGDDVKEEKLTISPGTTNFLQVKFEYGVAVIETEPSGAVVTGNDGRDWGTTPVHNLQLQTGDWDFVLYQNGYEPVPVSFTVHTGETNVVRTNLVSSGYVKAMASAKQYFAAGEYRQAAASASEALKFKSNDTTANALQKQASELVYISEAKSLRQRHKYKDAVKQAELALEIFPDNGEAKQLLDECLALASEQAGQIREARLHAGEKLLQLVLQNYEGADLFDTHQLKTTQPVKVAHAAIFDALQRQSEFRITKDTFSPTSDIFAIEAVQEFSTALATSAGRRQCVIVGAQTRDEETQILFKVLEYKTEAVNKVSIGAWIGAPVAVTLSPFSPRLEKLTDKLQTRFDQGVSNVTVMMKSAIPQAPTALR